MSRQEKINRRGVDEAILYINSGNQNTKIMRQNLSMNGKYLSFESKQTGAIVEDRVVNKGGVRYEQNEYTDWSRSCFLYIIYNSCIISFSKIRREG